MLSLKISFYHNKKQNLLQININLTINLFMKLLIDCVQKGIEFIQFISSYNNIFMIITYILYLGG